MSRNRAEEGRRRYNPKRRIARDVDPQQVYRLVESVKYVGSSEHKKSPGDFGLVPPASPRPDKTLCDSVQIFNKDVAQALLVSGVRKGMFSQQERNGYPQNIWALTDNGEPLEAQLDNRTQGTYHGYPMPENDPFSMIVKEYWEQR